MAVAFTGTANERLEVGGLSLPTSGLLSVAFIARRASGTAGYAVTFNDTATFGAQAAGGIELTSNGSIFLWAPGGLRAFFGASTLTADTWWFVGAVFGNGASTLYHGAVGGSSALASDTDTWPADTTPTRITWGLNGHINSGPLTGALGPAAFWTGSRSSAQMEAFRRHPFHVERSSALVGHWLMLHADTATRDESGLVRTLTQGSSNVGTHASYPPVGWSRPRRRTRAPAPAAVEHDKRLLQGGDRRLLQDGTTFRGLQAEATGVTGTVATSTTVSLAAAGTPVVTGTAAAAPTVSVAAAGTPVVAGTFAATTSASLVASGPGGEAATGTVAATTSVSVAAAGTPIVTGTAATTAATPSLVAAGTPTVSGAFAGTSAAPSVAAAGTPTVAGTVAASPSPSVVAAGRPIVTGTFAATTSVSVAAADSEDGAISGTVAATAPAPSVAAAGSPDVVGTAATTAAAPSLAASGAPVVSGTATLAVSPALVAAGRPVVTGSAAVSLAVPLLAAAGTPVVRGTFAATVAAPVVVALERMTYAGNYYRRLWAIRRW